MEGVKSFFFTFTSTLLVTDSLSFISWCKYYNLAFRSCIWEASGYFHSNVLLYHHPPHWFATPPDNVLLLSFFSIGKFSGCQTCDFYITNIYSNLNFYWCIIIIISVNIAYRFHFQLLRFLGPSMQSFLPNGVLTFRNISYSFSAYDFTFT